MNPHENSTLYHESLARYLSGEMSADESRDFEREPMFSADNKIKIEKMKNLWNSLDGFQEPKTPDTGKAWDTLYNRLNEEKLIPPQVLKTRGKLAQGLLRIAAVCVILLGISAVVYFTMVHKSAAEMVQINTENDANTLIKTLNDGSVIYIAQNSLFTFPKEFENNSRNVSLSGEAFFDIKPNPDKPFIIETDETFIEVLGTAFNVKTQNGTHFELIVNRGKVKVTLKSDPSRSEFVVAGEKITTEKNLLVKSINSDNQLVPWFKQRMHFKDESLQNIISVLNRNFNTTFVIREKAVGNRKMTVTFNNETVETMTNLICQALNLKSQTINGSVVLFENKESSKQN